MHTVIYYFSATGNSLAIARRMARNLGDTEVIRMEPDAAEPPIAGAMRIGLVFPVHMWGVPSLVVRFISALKAPEGANVFAVATSGGMPCGTLKQLRRVCAARGIRLAAGFSLPMVNNCTSIAQAPSPDKQRAALAAAMKKADKMCDAIGTGKRYLHGGIPVVNWLFYRFMYLRALPKIAAMDANYSCDWNCSGCGMCAAVCPVSNIVMENGRPSWRHHCEACYGCLQWCPRESIQLGTKTAGRRRYRNPEVRFADIARIEVEPQEKRQAALA
jgi:ferredoxin